MPENEEDDDISIDFGKWFKRKKENKKEESKENTDSTDTSKKAAEKNGEDDEHIHKDSSARKEHSEHKAHKTEHKEHKAEEKPKEETEDDEISFDFSKIRNWFKHKKGHEEHKDESKEKKDDEEEISIDWGQTANFFKKYAIIFLVLIPLFLAVFIRMQTAALPFTDEWATNSVNGYFKTQIRNQINQQYPNLPDTNKENLVEKQFQQFLQQNKDQVNQQIKQTSQYFKTSYQDDNGNSYMPDIDPYYWYRYAKNVVEKGNMGDEIRDGQPYDNHMLAPNGRFISKTDSFHSYFLAYFYNIIHVFNPSMPLLRAIEYYPVIISMLSIIPAFFIGRRIAGNAGGFFAATMLAVNQAFLSRTMWGHADTDAWNIFFPLYVSWLFIEAFTTNNKWKRIIFTSLAGFLLGLYSLAWGGWWYIFDFIIASLGIYFIYYLIVHRSEFKKGFTSFFKHAPVKNLFIMGVVFLVSTGIFVTLFYSFNSFVGALRGPFSFTTIKAPVQETLWPNVLTTVAELNEGNMSQIINSIGGKFLFFISIIGILLTIIKKDEHGKYEIKYAAFLTIWFIGSIYASIKGIRFTLLLAPAFSIAFGVALGLIFYYVIKWASKELKINKTLVGIVLIILFSLLFISPAKTSLYIAQHDVPIINDAWYNSLTAIKNNSSENAIINSWWDFGHHFKALADRAVTFDGTTQDSPQAHWIGKTLLTDDEEQAIAILRMLDCGGNNAFDEVFKVNKNSHASIDLIYQIIILDKLTAKQKLIENEFTETQTDDVLKYTHCAPPEDYFITSEDMVGKSGVWSHFGSWDFERADIWQNLRKLDKESAVKIMIEKFNYTKEKAEQLYYETQSITTDRDANNWVAPWPSYVSGLTQCTVSADIVSCANGLQVNLSSYEASIPTQTGIVNPTSLVYADQKGFYKKEYAGNIMPYSAALIPSGDSYQSILMQPELAGSMFTRLFFFKGHGLKHFTPFNYQRSITGNEIYIWKIDWPGSEPLNAFESDFKSREEIKASHILIMSASNATEEEDRIAKQKIEEIFKKVNEGTDFNSLAEQYSEDSSVKTNKGDLGWFKHGVMVKEFEDAAFALKNAGDVSGIVKGPFGYHIIKLTGRRAIG